MARADRTREDARLKALLAEGRSYAACARILANEGFPARTRDAHIARARRFNLAPATPEEKLKARFGRVRRKSIAAATAQAARQPKALAAAVRPKEKPLADAPAGGLNIFDILAGQCRWPLWADHNPPPVAQRMMCAAGTADGESYCPVHRGRAYQPGTSFDERRKQRVAA